MKQGPAAELRMIGGKAQLSAIAKNPRKFGERIVPYDSSFLMTALGPRIWKQQENPRNTRGRQHCHKQPRIVLKEPYISQFSVMPIRNKPGNTIEIGLTTDKPAFGMSGRLRSEVLACAEAYLQPYLTRPNSEQG